VEGRVTSVVEADVHRVDIINAVSSRRFQSSSNSSPVKTSHKWTTVTSSRCSPRHQPLSNLRDGNIDTRNCGLHIGQTSSNVETRSSAKAEVGAVQSRRVRSCEYNGDPTATPPRVRPPVAALRGKGPVFLLPPPPERRTTDKVPRYNDTGSFEEVDERFLMLEGFHGDRRSNSLPATGPGQQTSANVRTLSAGRRSSLVMQNVVGTQCRKLWDLRATLEQSGEVSDDGQSESSMSPAERRQTGETGEKSRGTRERVTGVSAPSFLPLPSHVRRQTYQYLAVERQLRQPAAASSSGPPGASVDSVEAPETDGDASDTSRYDLTTTSFESSTTTTTTTDNNTDAGDGRAYPPSSMRSPHLSGLSAAHARLDDGSQEGKALEVLSDVDAASRAAKTFVDTPPSSSPARRSCSDVSDEQATGLALDTSEQPGFAASLRSAARKRRDFRNERTSVHRLALDYDDIHSSTDQPSGDSVDGGGLASPSGVTSTAASANIDDPTRATKCAPSSALQRFLSYQLSSHSTTPRHLRGRRTRSRDYRLVMGIC